MHTARQARQTHAARRVAIAAAGRPSPSRREIRFGATAGPYGVPSSRRNIPPRGGRISSLYFPDGVFATRGAVRDFSGGRA